MIPLLTDRLTELDQMFAHSAKLATETGFAKNSDTVVLVAGVPIGLSGSTNLLRGNQNRRTRIEREPKNIRPAPTPRRVCICLFAPRIQSLDR